MKNANLKKDKWTTLSGAILLALSIFVLLSQMFLEVKTEVPLWALGVIAIIGVWLIRSPDSFFKRVDKIVEENSSILSNKKDKTANKEVDKI